MNVSAEMLRKHPTVFKCLKRVAVELLLLIMMMMVRGADISNCDLYIFE